jgi:hypothetical protein
MGDEKARADRFDVVIELTEHAYRLGWEAISANSSDERVSIILRPMKGAPWDD